MSIEKNESVNAKPINDGIHNLKYDPRKILAFKGSDVSGIPETEAVDKGGVCYVTTNTKHTFTSNYDVAVSSAIKDVTYPGALVKANSKLVEGAPDPYVFDRRGMKVTIDLPGLGDKNTRLVNEISYGTVSAAVDGLIEDWVKECADEHGISSNMNYIRSIMYDENLTALKFGCDVGYLKQKLGIDFNMIRDQKKSSYMIMFKQVFYTVSVKPPVNPADPFADNVTWNDLTVGGVNDENPPAYVRNVEYGRQIFFVMESSLSSSELEALVNGCVTVEGVSCHVDLDAKYKEQAKKVHCKITTLGGTAVMIDGSLADEEILNQLNKLICENTQLSLKNPGAPLN
ncbi:MAG: thiol-activated cytolysin family protein, partial [Fibrobacter sp.]|nr:thiol-activated cytolysin family protein [Fibrobacter sp.]